MNTVLFMMSLHILITVTFMNVQIFFLNVIEWTESGDDSVSNMQSKEIPQKITYFPMYSP